ncbi:hypothetical protein DM01DRAFT_1337423 [Hesseltinella vesiculosa]|uniref:Uncharacterized protein n=1 Tax=Hesseltinella vesiculosa TaxID=101127 RepID=A0A1X2GCL5_9FUNG|nr:hypothetical protein DM01DRAFT_1337423 [Hesseltinella vesiculosa]
MVSKALFEVPAGTYATADAEWCEGHGDCLYLPNIGIQHSLPSILVEVQSIVNATFMARPIRNCQQVQTLYQVAKEEYEKHHDIEQTTDKRW